MANEVVIPMLHCPSIKDTLEFYRALGFEVTFEQSQPNTYASVKYNDIRLDFFVKRNWNPAFCYIKVSDVDGLHRAFVDGIKETYGKRLSKGTPRITSVNTLSGDRRFNVVDPGGNWLYIGQPLTALEIKQADQQSGDTRLAKAVMNARAFTYSKGDAQGAAKILDVALTKNEVVPVTVRFKALVLRADIAVMMNNPDLAKKLLRDVRTIELQDDERLLLNDEVQRMGELEGSLEAYRDEKVRQIRAEG